MSFGRPSDRTRDFTGDSRWRLSYILKLKRGAATDSWVKSG
jgi:hypothetical protein